MKFAEYDNTTPTTNNNTTTSSSITNVNKKLGVELLVHFQDIGDVKLGPESHSITQPGRRLEGFQINHSIPDVQIEYMGHVEDIGDTDWKKEGSFVGSRGKSKRLEGIAVRLSGTGAALYDVCYYVHLQGVEEAQVVSNGVFAGKRGESRKVEGIAVWLEYKHVAPITKPIEFVRHPHSSAGADYNLVASGDEIEVVYSQKCSFPSDINEHLPTLYRYARGSSSIAEFGVRSVVSTWAFLRALRDTNTPNKKLICVDLEKSENIHAAERAARYNHITLEFIEANDLTVDLRDGVDMLFIDTWHVYPQLIRELEMHSPKVRKYIAMHDTQVDGEKGESRRLKMNIKQQSKESGFSEADIRTGLAKAVKEFLEHHREWRTCEVFTNNNGLTVLERV